MQVLSLMPMKPADQQLPAARHLPPPLPRRPETAFGSGPRQQQLLGGFGSQRSSEGGEGDHGDGPVGDAGSAHGDAHGRGEGPYTGGPPDLESDYGTDHKVGGWQLVVGDS